MSFSDNFLKELEKRKKKIDNAAVFSPYSSRSGKEAEKAKENSKNSNQWGFSDEFWEEIDRRADKVDRATLSEDDDEEDIAPVKNPNSKLGKIAAGLADELGVEKKSDGKESPSKKEEEEKSKKRTWFEKGAFSDGYDFGDITKTILGTGRDIREDLTSGLLGIAEKTVDAGATLVGGVGKLFGADGFADNMQGFVQKDLINEEQLAKNSAYHSSGFIDRILVGKDGEDESVLGEKSDSLVQSGGQLAGQIGLQMVGVPWYVTSGVTAFGGEAEQAFKEGAGYGGAIGSAAISAGAEILTEKLFGGSGLGEKGLINVDAITKGIANKTVKTMLDFGIDVAAEGSEEVISSVFNRLGSKLYKEESLGELLLSEEAFDEYLEGFIGGAVLGGGMNAGKAATSIQEKTDYRSGLTANEEAVVNREAEKRIEEAEKDGKKLTNKEKAQIRDSVEKDLDKGYISTDTIEEVLGGETYKSYQDTVKNEDALKSEFDELKKVKTNDATLEQNDRYNELKKKLSELETTSERSFLESKYKNEAYEVARGSRLEESYNERARRGEKFTADLSKYNKKQQTVIQKAIDSGILNNTNRTHEFVDLVSKIAADKGVSFDFTNNEKLKSSGFAVDGMTVNGYVTKDGVTVNIQSSKSLNSVVGHEIAHVLEGTELYSELQKAITEYAKSKGDYQGRFDTLSKLYENIEGADVNAELTADLVGDYLFTDADFVNNLSVNHRNVFQKIYDEIKYLYKVATAGTKEARELEKVKRAFEEAYRAQGKAQGDTKYALSKDVNGDVFVDVTEDIFDANNGESVARTIQRVISERFNNLIDVHGQKIQINKTTNDEFRRSESVNHLLNNPSQAYDDKLKTIANADEILTAAKNWIGEEIKHVRKDDIVEFARGNVTYRVGENGYVADVIVGTRKNGAAVLYDLVNIYDKKITEAPVTMASNDNSQRRQDASAKPIVSQEEENVKRQFSLSDSDGRQLSKEQQDYFKDSKIKDENGNLLVMYHGTPNGEFTVFKDGTYFTANKEYADKYQNPGASSLNSRKVASSPKTFEVYLNITKPFDINDPEARNIYINDYIKGGNAVGINPYLSDAEYNKIDSIDWTEGEDLREFLIDNGYDYDGLVLDEGATGGYGEEVEYRGMSYVVFSPEQVKNVDNKNPTSNPDINRSLSGEGETQRKYGSYNVYGKDIAYEGAAADVAPIRDDIASAENDVLPDNYAPMTEEEAAMREGEILDSLTDEDAPPEVDTSYDVQRDTGTIEDKPLKKISEKASEYLGLNRNERVTFENIVQNYSQNENLDRDYLFSQIKDNFSIREEIMQNEDVRQMKKDIKSMGIFVSDSVKGDFGKGQDGYIKFLRSNFGKLRIVKDAANGIEVDSAYEELSSLYPSYFPEDIINPADRLRQIADVAGMSSEESFPIEVSEAEIQEVADMVYIGVSEYMNDSRLDAAEASKAPHSDTDAPLIESDIETENKVLSVREMYDQKKQNYRDSLAALEAGKEKSQASFNEAIGKKLNEYNALKNKNTKRANTLLQQIENLRLRRDNVQGDYTNRIAKQQVRLENFESKDFSEFENKVLAVRRKDIHGKIIEEAKAQYEAQGLDLDEVLEKAKDLSTFSTVDNTPQRVMEKSLGYKEGKILSDITVNKVAQNETEGIKWLNTITDKKNGLLAQLVKQYGIKPGSKESAAAQMYAEGFFVDTNGDVIKYGDAELAKDFPNEEVRQNIIGLARDQRVRQFYDETLDKINESRARNAYPEIQKLENYFLHFRAMEDTFSRLGLPFNPNDIKAKDLPTDLNGVTADLKPGQPYFASAKHREGKRTSFDLLGGLEKYATSAKNQIYHIDDIQTLRAIRNYVADTYGQAKGLSDLDALTEEEVQERIKEVYGSHLSTFAKFLNEEANVLAGKTALIDRGFEGIFGRRAMTFMDSVNRQVGSNMVGYNISSALTNLIAPVQAFAKTNKADFIKGFAQTVSNKIGGIFGKGDSFTDESPVVIRRKGADQYYRTAWQKLSDPGYALMGAVDNFSTELIARAKYNELTRKGMDSETAHVETDKWVSRLMGDRSLGQMPQLYNSKMLGLVTKFQLEVRNQLDSQFYDTIQEAKASTEDIENGLHRNAKRAAKITSTFFTLAVGQHLFGKAFESIAGYNPAFDIISALIKTLGLDDEEESEDTFLDNIEQGFFELMGDMPYTSILEGGRIPISSALPIEELYKGKDQYGNEKSRWETVLEALPYYTMPGGYGQLKKTTQGLGMFDEEHPISGSYTDSGKLRFPVEDNFLNRVQAGIFGQYASPNARDYFDNERKALDEKQIQEFVDSGISIQDYWNYREGLSGLKTLNEKADYINGLDLPIEVKNLLINNLSGRKDPIDLSGMEGYTDFNEYDFAQKNPEKYEWLKANGITVEQYEGFDKETKEEYDFAYKSPEKYVVAKSVGGYSSYKTYASDLYDIKADKDEDGKTISGSRKEKVIDYINNLDADYGEKIILFKSEYPADDTYNYEIIDYLNGRDDISYEDMVTILKELGFTVKGDTVYWD